jgi:hypothetical protein
MFDVDTLTLLDALRRTMLAVDVAAGILVGIDSVAVVCSYPEKPAHRPRANALSWLISSLTMTLVGSYLLYNRYTWVGDDSPVDAKIAILILYAGIAAAFTSRAVTRATKPWLTVTSAILMSVFGTILVLLDGLP